MPSTPSRRAFLQLLCAGAAAAAFPDSISRALEIPAHHRTGTIRDVEHIVFLMQENRSFDHYFGTLRGVRGFGDPRAVMLPSGHSVFHQPGPGLHPDGYILPFHPGAPNLGLRFLEGLPHDWTSTQKARNRGRYNRWVPSKGPTTMAHLTRGDIPFHFALADAFTICDAYHCSLLGPTDPNRFYMWSGCCGNNGQGGGPVVDNAEAGYGWPTYPEALEEAGISWKVYQDRGTGLNKPGEWGNTSDAYIGNYGDNALLYFSSYQDARPGSPLHDKAVTGTSAKTPDALFGDLRSDIASGNLPQVSWIIAPEAYSEHPNWPANYGAWYVSQVLDSLTARPEVWSKTALFLMYDENDGFFDHMVPPTPPGTRAQGLSTVDTANEIFPGSKQYPAGPYGLGVRVPMLVISPWSKGGWVNSEVFDHTSMIRFIELRFGHRHHALRKTNITPWRRAVCGDLTSTFNFSTPNNTKVRLPRTVSYAPPDNARHPDYVPHPPAEQALPPQEEGTRPARAVPYELHVEFDPDFSARSVRLDFHNTGKVAAVFQVREASSDADPRSYTVGHHAKSSDTWPCANGSYDLSIYGPNGFFRAFRGTGNGTALRSRVHYEKDQNGVRLELKNEGHSECNFQVTDAYTGTTTAYKLGPEKTLHQAWQLDDTFGWYDLTLAVEGEAGFRQQFAGHLETGEDSQSDPAIGKKAAG
ncbi:MAG: phospholipase C, phosphocholine-specific [Acidobacteriaceae bacterium]